MFSFHQWIPDIIPICSGICGYVNLRLGQLLLRARQLLSEAKRDEPGEQEPQEPPLSRQMASCIFRADWLGMFLTALARGRCRSDVETLKELLEVHFSKNVLEGNLAVSGVCTRCLQTYLKRFRNRNALTIKGILD